MRISDWSSDVCSSDLDAVVAALVAGSKSAEQPRSLRLNAAVLPAVGAALLPKLSCPVCWPAYAGLLSSFGIGFVDYTPSLLPLTAVFVSVSVLALAWMSEDGRFGDAGCIPVRS